MTFAFHAWLLVAVVAAIPLAALPVTIGSVQLPLTEILLALAVVSAVTSRLRGKERDDAPHLQKREMWPVAMFLLAALLSMLVTEYPRQSLRELRLLIVEPVVLYVLLRAAPLDATWVRRAVTAFVGVIAVLAIVALGLAIFGRGLTEAEGVQRLKGLYPSPNHFALILGRAIPFSLALALAGGRRWSRYAVITVILALALTSTFSGGGWMGTAGAVLAVVWMTRGTRLAIGLLALGGVLAGVALTVLRVERIASRLDPTRGTGFIRIKLWEASLAMLRDHPILGIGLDNFLYRYQQDYLPSDAAAEPNLSHPHNWALNFWLSLGLLGFAAVLWLLVQFAAGIRNILKHSEDPVARALAIGAAGSMVNFLVHGFVDNSYFLPDMALLFWFTLAIPRILNQQR